MTAKLRTLLCVLLLYFSTPSVDSQSEKRDEISVASERELRNALAEQTPMLVRLVDDIFLKETLLLRHPGVVVSGGRSDRRTLRCHPSLRTPAVVVRSSPPRRPQQTRSLHRAADVTLRSLHFEGCAQDTAVVVEPLPGSRLASASVLFDDVLFEGNGARLRELRGGAVRCAACPEDCQRPALTFRNCTFNQNRAAWGGAVFAEDADLDVEGSAFLENRADLAGGAVYTHNALNAQIQIRNSSFERNVALGDAEAHGMEERELLTTANATVAHIGTGGALHAWSPFNLTIQNSAFDRNAGCRGGGGVVLLTAALSSMQTPSSVPNSSFLVTVNGSRFANNQAFCGLQPDAMSFFLTGRVASMGGGLYLEHLDDTDVAFALTQSVFLNNTAHSGGGLGIRAPSLAHSSHRLAFCRFYDNVGIVSGGSAIYYTTRVEMISVHVHSSRATYGAGIMAFGGTDLSLLPDPDDPDDFSVINGTTAIYGGGLYVDGASMLLLARVMLRNNTAFRYGGGFRSYQVTGTVTLSGLIIEGNTALAGAGVAVLATNVLTVNAYNGQPTIIRDNRAVVGGGFFYEPGHSIFLAVTLEDCQFLRNRALAMSNPEMQGLVERGYEYQPLPSAGVKMPRVQEQLGSFSLFSFLTDLAEGHGGGIAMSVVNIRLFTLAQILFRNLYVAENEAIVGGGMAIHQSDLYWNRVERTSCFPAAVGLDTCQLFVIQNATVTRNAAQFAGGIFAVLPDGISLTCGPGHASITAVDLVQDDTHQSLLERYCSFVSGNRLSDDAQLAGADAGTRASKLVVEGWNGPLKHVASGEALALPCPQNRSADCSVPLRIAVKDIFNQTIVRGIADANLTLTLLSHHIFGDLTYTAVNGIALIDNTFARGVNVSSHVTIRCENNRNLSVTLSFGTRACNPGELLQGEICRSCPDDQYSFHPLNKGCEGCEANAECEGGASLVPAPGYWHSNPFSPLMTKCIFRAACEFEGRQKRLKEFYRDRGRLAVRLAEMEAYVQGQRPRPDFSDYEQCAEGYDGPLCGSCQDGYGLLYTGACEKCPEKKGLSRLFVCLVAGWLFLLIGANCAITMLSTNARVQLVKHEARKAADRQHHPLTRARPLGNTSIRVSRLIRQATDSSREPSLTDPQVQEILASQLVTTVQLTETLKILINYLQVTVAAVQLQTDWSVILDGLLRVEAAFTGLSQEVVDVPCECNFDSATTPASVSALWMRIATPWLVLLSLHIVFTIGWCIRLRHAKLKKPGAVGGNFTRERFLTYLIMISVVATYFSYIDVFRDILRTINCVELEESEELLPSQHPYLRYSERSDERRVWAEDTDLVCFEGSHLPLGIVGVVGLVVSLGGIVTILVWLPLNKKRVTKTEFVARYWFLYQGYRKKWYTNAWESTILTRKALIAAVVVFSAHIEPTLQASLCAGVLMIAHMVHAVLHPFRTPKNHERVPEYAGDFLDWFGLKRLAPKWVEFHNAVNLNALESMSLSASIVVFFSVLILHDAESSELGRLCMVIFTFLLNVGFLLYMVYRLYAGLHVLVDLRLEMTSSSFLATEANAFGVVILGRKLLELLHFQYWAESAESDADVEATATVEAD